MDEVVAIPSLEMRKVRKQISSISCMNGTAEHAYQAFEQKSEIALRKSSVLVQARWRSDGYPCSIDGPSDLLHEHDLFMPFQTESGLAASY